MTAELSFKSSMVFTYGEPSEMGPGIRRVVAENPGPLTHNGTNTYLVGAAGIAVIDPGPDDPAHRCAILAAAGKARITHILVTHAHRDHVDGAAGLKAATGAPILAVARGADEARRWQTYPTGKSFINTAFQPDRPLAHGDLIEGDGWALRALHTPGHAPDHVCFALDAHRIVFSGDHVMAWNTTVVAPPEGRMADYLASLEMLLDRHDEVFLPGHGGRLADPQRAVKAYLLHRRWREQAILDAVRGGVTTVRAIVPAVYGKIEGQTAVAAALSVQAHVEYLMEKRILACSAALSFDAEICAA